MNSTAAARSILDGFTERHGQTVEAMRQSLNSMIVTGNEDDLMLYSSELQHQHETIMKALRGPLGGGE